MKVLPITVMFSEGPIARAYLALLKRRGYLVDQIIELLPKPHRVGLLVPKSARERFLSYTENHKMNYWPKRLPVLYPQSFANIVDTVATHFELGEGFFEEIAGNVSLSSYCSAITRIEVSGLADEELSQVVYKQPNSVVLFTGGGLVPPKLTRLDEVRLLHIHPGYLPFVRGADGLLWSMLVRGRPGASAFFMTPGIDEGDLLLTTEFEPLNFLIAPDELPDTQNMYRMVYSFYDPIVRAALLCDLIDRSLDFTDLVGQPQDLKVGRTFHFMGERMRIEALSTIFKRY